MGKSIPVQGTNDSSIVSKCSMANKGYFDDEFVKYFANKSQRRTSLINRGYYIRSKAINTVFINYFMSLTKQYGLHVPCQVLSFGAGFDTSYFRMKSKGYLPVNCKYYEIDFIQVVKRKAHYIKQNCNLQDLIGENKYSSDLDTVIAGVDYFLLGVNLEDVDNLQKLLESNKIDYSIPTIALSECVLIYMDASRSDHLIKWVARSFHNAMFITYEQVYPNDGFGMVMQNHFQTVGSPLKSIKIYPSIKSQKQRYLEMGWPICFTIGMNDFYKTLPSEEHQHIESLEMFDEFEEWHLKCSHYVMICASHDICLTSMAPVYKVFSTEVNELNPYHLITDIEIQIESADAHLQRFGHQSVLIPTGQIITSGGFGKQQGKHQRLSELIISGSMFGNSITCQLWDEEKLLGSRIHHTIVALNSCHLLVIGGRSSPAKPYEGVLLLHPMTNGSCFGCLQQNVKNKVSSSMKNSSENKFLSNPSESGSSVNVKDKAIASCVKSADNKINVPHANLKCTLDAYDFININMKNEQVVGYFSTRMIATGAVPCPRWRHTATVVMVNDVENVVLFGGCSATCTTLDDCYVLDTKLKTWTEIPKQLSTPCSRHTHSSVSWDSHSIIVSCGLGNNIQPLNSVHLLQMSTRTWVELHVVGLLPRYSHTSHIWQEKLILIGGVNTFHDANPGIAIIDLVSLQAVEFKLPFQDPSHPILCHNHCSVILKDHQLVVIIGGGGNCFSFGTHLNKNLYFIPLESLLQKSCNK